MFSCDAFLGFGPTACRPCDFEPTLGQVRSHKRPKLREGVREQAPREPGVYGMFDRLGNVIYIGKAKSLRARLMSYFRDSSDPKAGRILKHTHSLVWESISDEFASLLRELELIRRFRPRFNVIGQPGHRRYCYVSLGRAPAPTAYVTRAPAMKDLAVYGPFTSGKMANDSVRRINDWFRLRDCPQSVPMVFSDQLELFPQERSPRCLRYEIETCSGPCVGSCSRSSYSRQVNQARAFLDGTNDRPLHDLKQRMEQASLSMEFERAAAIRDQLASLEWIWEKLNWLRKAREENTFIYPITGSNQRTVWYLVHRGRVRGACFRPIDTKSGETVRSLLEETYRIDPGPITSAGPVDHVLLVAAWFRKFPEQRDSLLSRDAALGLCLGNECVTPSKRKAAGPKASKSLRAKRSD
jgi:excinuclease ABC subunit C